MDERWKFKNYAIGIDLGTTSVKVVGVDTNGRIVGTSSRPCRVAYPRYGWAEQDPNEWTKATFDSLRELSRRIGSDNVVGIGLGSHMDGVVPVDQNGGPIRNAIIWMDRRAAKEAEWIATRVSPSKVKDITGSSVDAYHAASKILWLREHESNAFESASYFLLPSNASSTMLMDIGLSSWSKDLCNQLDIPFEKLPEIKPAIEVAGHLTDEASAYTKLPIDIPVTIGGGDQEVGALGAGVIEECQVLDIIGTGEPICACLNHLPQKFDSPLELRPHSLPGKFLLENPGMPSGAIIEWLVSKVQLAKSLKEFDETAAMSPPGSRRLIFLPFMMGSILPEWNHQASGGLVGLSLSHSKSDIARAVLEGLSFVLRDYIQELAKFGVQPREVIVTGGGSKSDTWMQIKSDAAAMILLRTKSTNSTALGASMLPLIGSGILSISLNSINQFIGRKKSFRPSPGNRVLYDAIYRAYRSLYSNMKPSFNELGATGSG